MKRRVTADKTVRWQRWICSSEKLERTCALRRLRRPPSCGVCHDPIFTAFKSKNFRSRLDYVLFEIYDPRLTLVSLSWGRSCGWHRGGRRGSITKGLRAYFETQLCLNIVIGPFGGSFCIYHGWPSCFVGAKRFRLGKSLTQPSRGKRYDATGAKTGYINSAFKSRLKNQGLCLY